MLFQHIGQLTFYPRIAVTACNPGQLSNRLAHSGKTFRILFLFNQAEKQFLHIVTGKGL